MKPEVKEAYECGYEEGYEAAMEEMHGQMGERSSYGNRMGAPSETGFGMRSGMGERSGMGMRSNTFVEGEDRGMLGERRGRDSMGRYR